jgi:hypothetical protein
MIEYTISGSLEGDVRKEQLENEKIYVNAQRTGPVTRSGKGNVSSDQGEPGLPKKTVKFDETTTKVRPRPYVELPPKRVDVPSNNPVKVDTSPKLGPVYKNRAPVELGLDIEKLVDTVLDMELNIPLRSLAGISSVIQKEIKKQLTRTKVPTEVEPKVVFHASLDEPPLVKLEGYMFSSYTITEDVCEDFPEGHLVASDPILQYLAEHGDAEADKLIVANISEPLRAIYGTVNQVGQEECLLDNGSMIVSMSRKAAEELGLTWDPNIRINMESASNHLEKTLGLARNVKLALGDINVYLQVHILENPPYRLLLGRPFDKFTRSEIKTEADGSSQVVLTDPNTKKMVVMPTYKRGEGPAELQNTKFQGF